MDLSGLANIPFADFISFVVSLLNTIIALCALLAVGYLVYAGFLYILSRGEGDRAERAQRVIVFTLIGLIIVFVSPLIVRFILDTIINVK